MSRKRRIAALLFAAVIPLLGILFILSPMKRVRPIPCQTSDQCLDGRLCIYKRGCDTLFTLGYCDTSCGQRITHYCTCDGVLKRSGNTCIEEPHRDVHSDPSFLSCYEEP